MKKIFCLVLAIVMCISGACFQANAATIDVAQYRDWDFYSRSCPEYIGLQMYCDTISFYGRCAETPDEPELLICYIVGITNPSYANTFEFYADESVTTYAYALPIGLYKICFLGSADVLKDYVVVTFTQFD